MTAKRILWASLVVLSVLMYSALPAMAQSNAGQIGGTVMDSTGAVLPGANVTLSSATSGTLGARQEVVSDSRGTYQFLQLVPGTYIVHGEMQGFRPAEQRNISVVAGSTSRADLTMQLGALAEGVTVAGEAPLLDTTSATRQTVLSQEQLQSLPNRMDVWSITRIIPSVVSSKVDVGGSESFQQSSITVHGTSGETEYDIDGMNVTGTQGAGATASFYLDPFAFSENNFQAGNAPAESAIGGLVFNMISRTGSNALHGGATFSNTNGAIQSNNINSKLAAQLLLAVPASIKAVNPNVSVRADVKYFYDDGAWLAGPVKKDKLWFSMAWHHQQNLQHNVGFLNPDGTPVPDSNYLYDFSGKLALQISQPSQLTWFYVVQHKVQAHTGSGLVTGAATQLSSKFPQFHEVKYTRTIGSKMVFDVTGTTQRLHDLKEPTVEVQPGAIASTDSVTGASWNALATYSDLPNKRYDAHVNLGYFMGGHDLKAGYQFDYAYNGANQYSLSGLRAVYRNGVPDSVNTYALPISSEAQNRQQGLFIQDKWQVVRKLTVNMGVRLDTNYGWQPALCNATNQFVTGACFPAIKGVPNFKAVNPRFSMIYDVAGDGRTALKFAANRYIVPLGASILARINPISTASDTRPWTACAAGQVSGCDLNGDKIPQVNELGASSGYSLGQNNSYAAGTSWPYAVEISAEIQRQLFGDLVMTAGYTHRQTKGNFASRNLLVPAASYIPLTVTETNSGAAVTVFNQAPALKGQQQFLWDNAPELDNTYSGGDISLQKRLSHGWMLTGGVSLGRTIGWTGGTDLNNPNQTQFATGVVGNDIPYSVRLSGLYELPLKISMSGTFQDQAGPAENTTVSVGNNTVALTQGTTTVTTQKRGTVRLPAVHQLDMSFRRPFKFGSRSFAPRLDAYNLVNSATVTAWTQTLGTSYHNVTGVQRGRTLKLGASFDF
jgi:outer membrane receptor protein involved in Fe transport